MRAVLLSPSNFIDIRHPMSTASNGRGGEVMRKLAALIAKEESLRGSIEPHSMHEAEATAKAIQRLVLRYHLSQTDIELSKANQRSPVDALLFDPAAHGLPVRKRRVFWQEELAAIVAEAHLCGLLVVPGSTAVFFVGREQEREACAYAYGLLLRFAEWRSRREAQKEKPRYGEGSNASYRDAWLRGFNLRIASRYREIEESMVKSAIERNDAMAGMAGGTGTTGMALLCRLPNARMDVVRWIEQNVGEPEVDLVKPPVYDLGGLSDGFAAGAEPTLGKTKHLR